MTSEIRANTLKNRVGLGTVSFTNTGPVVSGIVTIANSTTEGVTLEDNAGVGNSLKITTPTGYVSIGSGNATFVHLNTDRGVFYFQKRIFVDEGIIASYDENLILQSPMNTNRITINKDTGLVSIVNDLDVDGHTNLDNVSIVGVTTTTSNIEIKGNNKYLKLGASDQFSLVTAGSQSYITNSTGHLTGRSASYTWENLAGSTEYLRIDSNGMIGIGGVVPKTQNTFDAIEFGKTGFLGSQTGARTVEMASNAYYNSGWKYKENDVASQYYQYQGYHAFTNAVSGSADGAISFVERLRIASDGQILIGVSAARTMFSGYTPSLQVEGTANSDSSVSIVENISGAAGPSLWFGKTRGSSLGDNTVVQSGDELGTIVFNGADGTDVQTMGAYIRGTVDGSVSSNNVPGRLQFHTASGGTMEERLRIASNGKIHVKGNGGDSSTDFSDVGTFFNLKHDTYGGRIGFSNGTASQGVALAELLGYWGSNKVAGWVMNAAGDATNRDDGQMSFYTRKSGEAIKERFHIGTEGQIVAGYRVGTSTVRSNQPVAFHSARVSPDANPRKVSTGQRCNLFVGSNTGWAAGDGGVLGLGGSETGNAGVEAMWSYLKGSRQSGNGWEYAGYFELGTSPWSGLNMAKRIKVWADGQIEVYPTDSTFFSTQIGGAQRMIIKHTGGGNIEIENSNGTMTFDTSSDYRLKKNEVAISNALSTVKALKPYQFTWKHDDKLGQGFLAHEAQAVLPDIGVVSGTKDAVHTKEPVRDEHHKIGDPIYQQIDYSKLVPLLTAALQEETAKREALEARVAALESS